VCFFILRCVFPVVCLLNQTIRYTHISSNTTIYEVVCYLLYVKHNYMFRPQILAIIRLYNENLIIGVHNCTIEYRIYITCSLLDLVHRISHITIFTIKTYCYVSHSRHNYSRHSYVYIWFLTNSNPIPPSPHLRDLALTPPPCTLYTPYTRMYN
jgi:hypothetical protein